ncbi:MAG: ornithine cyclodeaminase family protein [Clostridia bacterium]|nr:ornithine cyclodeaminase family protein [Clostridia bacterium]
MSKFTEKVMLIGNDTVQKYADADMAIKMVAKTWEWYGRGEIIMPPKITTDMSSAGVAGWFNSMPCYVKPYDIAGIKLVGGYDNNKKKGMPYIKANIMLTDPNSGMLKAVVSGDWISDFRTGSQPAIMAKHLAYKTDVVTIIGSGLQGYTSLLCMSRLLDIKEVRVCDLSEAARKSFIAKFGNARFTLVEYTDNEAACRDSDIIITVTNADAELVKASWVKPGSLVMTMGSFKETEPEVVLNADVIAVDHVAQSLHRGNIKPLYESGLITESSFDIEIALLLAGKQKYVPSPDKRVYAQIVGMGCPDVVIAETVRRRIQEQTSNNNYFDMQS